MDEPKQDPPKQPVPQSSRIPGRVLLPARMIPDELRKGAVRELPAYMAVPFGKPFGDGRTGYVRVQNRDGKFAGIRRLEPKPSRKAKRSR